ncbi:hypothetical protein C772_00914 [Bhargavaea cecembensis DSE10]|uniref:Uncharacterized protein n=1 Tax=Bhargavaea cecembensis DSE10 TaxID=1235279 RepID=M7P9X3_9BACL|nr:hypothetical protein [Bhargavaea cecembensis]EMR07269.1 hypothetical protein C772_00914 [Bhargavaea cecembensis DSE10]
MEKSQRDKIVKRDRFENRDRVEKREKVENLSKTVVGHSGNSDVDLTVNIEIDTRSIAYGMLCSLYARGELSDFELEKGLRKLEDLIERDRRDRRNKTRHSNAGTKPKLFEFPRSDEKKDDHHRSDRKRAGNKRNWL